MFVEKVLTCTKCGKQTIQLVLTNTDTNTYVCPSCEIGQMDFNKNKKGRTK